MKQLVSLEIDDLAIYQDKGIYSFTQDSVILANLANITPKDRVIDFGCGNGILTFLSHFKKHASFSLGIEIQKELFDLCVESSKYNHCDKTISFINGDVRDINKIVEHESFSVALCNPPYFISSIDSENSSKSTARTDKNDVLNDFCKGIAFALKFGGDAYISYKVDRMCDLICTLRKYNLEPKKLFLIYTKLNKDVDLIIVKARKGASPGLQTASITIMDSAGKYTSQFMEIIK